MKSANSDQTAFLYRVAAAEGVVDDVGLLRAAAQCLTPDQVRDVVISEAGRSSDLRDAVVRRLTQEPNLLVDSTYEEMAASLLYSLSVADARARQGIGYCLSAMYQLLPPDAQEQVVTTFLASRYIGLRRRGYKIQGGLDSPDLTALKAAWAAFKDAECAWLLTKHLSPSELVGRKTELLLALDEPWKVSRLFLRMAESRREIVEELRAVDAISYCYVMAKLGIPISDRDARQFIRESELDDRLGLLVWSIGKMKLTKTLKWLLHNLPAMQERKLLSLKARYDA